MPQFARSWSSVICWLYKSNIAWVETSNDLRLTVCIWHAPSYSKIPLLSIIPFYWVLRKNNVRWHLSNLVDMFSQKWHIGFLYCDANNPDGQSDTILIGRRDKCSKLSIRHVLWILCSNIIWSYWIIKLPDLLTLWTHTVFQHKRTCGIILDMLHKTVMFGYW